MVAHSGQIRLPFPISISHQREKHFERREKVLGQFFTPQSLASWMVEIAASLTESRDAALDPACGTGVFLTPLQQKGFREVWGIDVDEVVLKRLSDSPFQLLKGDALQMLSLLENRFDVIATNHPFSAKYGRVTELETLRAFELGRGRISEAIEVLFLELCIRALRKGGALAIVLPEGILTNLPTRRVREWLCRNATPIAIVSLSRYFFSAKSCILFARKLPASLDSEVLLAHAEKEDDLSKIAQDLLSGKGLRKQINELVDNMSPLWHLKETILSCAFPMRPLNDFLEEMRCGSTLYGARRQFASSGIPFVSAKTITPFGVDLKRDGRFVAKGSPMDKPQAYTKVGDVLFVRVGVGCLGRVAAVLQEDEVGIADDYIYILRFRPNLLPEFFALYAQTRFFIQQIERFKRGTGTVTVPQKLLRQVLAPLLPLHIQQRFAAGYRTIHERFRQGQIPDSNLKNLVAELERTLAS